MQLTLAAGLRPYDSHRVIVGAPLHQAVLPQIPVKLGALLKIK